jgi:malonyl CoA-acyl carrier protein transacylase/phosphopantetheinyl transferase
MKPRMHIHDLQDGELVLIGAPDQSALPAAIARVSAYLDAVPTSDLKDIALTTGLEARQAGVVVAVVANAHADLRAKLALLRRTLTEPFRRVPDRKGIYLAQEQLLPAGRVAFIFPGEGSQYPHMLQDVCLHVPECRAAFDEADTACADTNQAALPSHWIFPAGTPPEGRTPAECPFGIAEGVLAVLAADTAFLRLLNQLGVQPDTAMGPGVGEVAALECAGALAFRDRDERVQALREGHAMMRELASRPNQPETVQISVGGLDRKVVEQVLARHGGQVCLTRANSPVQFGVCVHARLLATLTRQFGEAGGVVRLLPLNRPFHTPWFEPGVPRLHEFMRRWIRQPLRFPVYSCGTCAPLPAQPLQLHEPCARQWMQPVSFEATIERMYLDGVRVFIELGARGSLTACIEETLHRRPHLAVAMNRVHRGGVQQIQHALGALATHGLRFDISHLHTHRGSRFLDLDRPAASRRLRQTRSHALSPALPILRGSCLPAGFTLTGSTPGVLAVIPTGPDDNADTAPVTDTSGETDFPLIADAGVVAETPGHSIDLRLSLAIADHPFLADCALGTNQVSLADRALRGLTMVPLTVCAELMAETARRLAPDLVVRRVNDLRVVRWITLDEGCRTVRLTARRVAGTEAGATLIEAAIFDGAGEGGDATTSLLASMTLQLARGYPPAQPAPAFALHCPQAVNWQGTDLYPNRLFVGPHLQTLRAVQQLGDNGLVGELVVRARSAMLRLTATPRFSLDPFMFWAIASSLTVWQTREPNNDQVPLSHAVQEIESLGAPRPEGTVLRLRLAVREPHLATCIADAQILDGAGQLVARVQGFETRLFGLSASLHRMLLAPLDGFLSRPIPPTLLPTLSQDVVCCVAGGLPPILLDDPQEIWTKAAAALTLSHTERFKWREMGGSAARRHEWLMGRVAAKDAVRRCLLARYGRKWAAADVRIETDEAGKPRPQGDWRKHCGALMDISITHTPDLIVAGAAPNAYIGIDVERRDRSLSDTFIDGAFCTCEQELAAESGQGATALIRFWCAKEALAKALGTGLRYGASDLKVRSFDAATGRIELELTRLWLEAFPNLQGQALTVHTGLYENRLLSVCVLAPELLNDARGAGRA